MYVFVKKVFSFSKPVPKLRQEIAQARGAEKVSPSRQFGPVCMGDYSSPLADRYRSASMAALHPLPAAVIAWR